MAGFTDFLEVELLDHVFAPAAYTAPATIYMKLHTGDPGESAANNAAAHTGRVAVSFGTAAAGLISNDAIVTFASMTAAETITHFSLWDTVGPAGGNPLATGALSASKTVGIGDTLDFAVGEVDVTLD
jgi:hypothetical protein